MKTLKKNNLINPKLNILISLCLICRSLLKGVYVLTWIVNRKRVRRINVQEQFITAYGGLRGAVGFSLVEMIDSSIVPPKQMFVTTTLAVVMFTVFFQVKYSKMNKIRFLTQNSFLILF